MLAATARVVEGRPGGPLTRAADTYDHAARDLHGRTPRRHELGGSLRAIARLVAMTGRASSDETAQILALLATLTALADAVADLRHAQDRLAQANAARASATQLRAATERPTPPPLQPRRATAAAIHRHATTALIHRTPPSPSQPQNSRRRVQVQL